MILILKCWAQPLRVLILLDASRSMSQVFQGKEKIVLAKNLANRMLDSLEKFPNIELALRVYGSEFSYPPGKCTDSKLIVPFTKKNASQIRQTLTKIQAKGITPIAYSLLQALHDFPKTEGLHHIVIITDGIEECSGNMCSSAKQLLENGISFKPCIIGIGLNLNQQQQFKCVGPYFDIQGSETFSNVIKIIASSSKKPMSYQLDLLDSHGASTEERTAFSITDSSETFVQNQWIQCLNDYKLPDTLRRLPPEPFKIKIHTIPEQSSTVQHRQNGIHLHVPVATPQGTLQVHQNEGSEFQPAFIYSLVRDTATKTILYSHPLQSHVKYLSGRYDVQILTQPLYDIKSFDIAPERLHRIEIEQPGRLTVLSLSPGDGLVQYYHSVSRTWMFLKTFNAQTQTQWILQPGIYRVFWRNRIQGRSMNTMERTITVTSGAELQLKFPF